MDFVKHTPWLMPLVLVVMVGTVSVLRPAPWQGPSDGVPSGKNQKAKDEKGSSSDVVVSPAAKQNGPETGADKAECKTCSEHEKADLYEQRRMAEASERQVLVSVVGSVLVLLSLIFTGLAAWAASVAAKQAARSVDVQIRIEQPQLYVEQIRTDIDNWRIKFTVRNIGRTAAILSEYSAQGDSLDYLPRSVEYPHVVRVRGTVMRPDGDGQDLEIQLSEDAARRIWGGDLPVVFWGYFKYEDVFGRTRITGFGYRGGGMEDDGGNYYGPAFGFIWSRMGGSAYNYDREDKPNA